MTPSTPKDQTDSDTFLPLAPQRACVKMASGGDNLSGESDAAAKFKHAADWYKPARIGFPLRVSKYMTIGFD
jgi:hypothetical protein